jgi:membrane-associated phospholipid phosphatase
MARAGMDALIAFQCWHSATNGQGRRPKSTATKLYSWAKKIIAILIAWAALLNNSTVILAIHGISE